MKFEKKFLGRFQSDVATVTFSWIWILISIASAVIGSVAVSRQFYLMEWARYYENPFYPALIIYGFGNLFASGFLIYAISRKNHVYLLPWLITNCLGIPMFLLISIGLMIYSPLSTERILAACTGYLIAVFDIYCCRYIFAMYKHFQSLANGIKQSQQKLRTSV